MLPSVRNKVVIAFGIMFVSAILFGPIFTLHADEMGSGFHCLLMHQTVMCQMGILEHLNNFQLIFSSILQVPAWISVFALMFAMLGISIFHMPAADRFSSWPRSLFLDRKASSFDPLTPLFSDGVLNPKLFVKQLLASSVLAY
jgi:hypothetical protein